MFVKQLVCIYEEYKGTIDLPSFPVWFCQVHKCRGERVVGPAAQPLDHGDLRQEHDHTQSLSDNHAPFPVFGSDNVALVHHGFQLLLYSGHVYANFFLEGVVCYVRIVGE